METGAEPLNKKKCCLNLEETPEIEKEDFFKVSPKTPDKLPRALVPPPAPKKVYTKFSGRDFLERQRRDLKERKRREII
jgi:hypothetical protein